MPELPEVETIKIGLQKKIIGLKIGKIQILSAKSFIDKNGKPFDPSTMSSGPNGCAQGLRGQKVLNVWRRAKILGLDLNNVTLLFHLKMTGQLIYDDGKRFIGGHPTPDMRDDMPNAHTRVIFSFADGSHLYFNDQRRFGWIKVVDRLQVTGDSSLKNLGPEPLEEEFTWEMLKKNLLRHKGMPVKVALMDQSVVSGVGNIYSNEACFDAKIDPRKKVGDMEDGEFQAIHKGVIRAIKDGIKYGGATRAHFVDSEGHKGYFLDYAKVYWKNGKPCPVCKTVIKKITLGGRGTYFCPNCQH